MSKFCIARYINANNEIFDVIPEVKVSVPKGWGCVYRHDAKIRLLKKAPSGFRVQLMELDYDDNYYPVVGDLISRPIFNNSLIYYPQL